AFRAALQRAKKQGGALPPPPAVPIALVLKNDGTVPLQVRFGDAATQLTLDVRGRPGVVRVPAAGVEPPAFLRPRSIRIEPGGQEVVRLDRLIAGSRGRLEYVYLTEPGDYALTARLRVTAGGTVATVTSPQIHVLVGK